MYLIKIIIQVLTLMISGINGMLVGDIFLQREKLSKKKLVFYLSILVLSEMILWYKGGLIHFPYIASVLAIIGVSLFFKGKLSYKIWVYVMMIDILYTCNLFGAVIIKVIMNNRITSITWLTMELITGMCTLILARIFKDMIFYDKSKFKNISLKEKLSIVGAGVLYFFVIRTTEYTFEMSTLNLRQSILPIVAIYIIAIGGIWCISINHHHIKTTYEDEENKLQRSLFKNHLRTYLQVNKLDRKQQNLKQETRQDVTALLAQVDENKLENLKPLIERIETRVKTCKPYIITGNTILDMLINEKYNIACKNNIEMKVNISLPEKLGMGTIDLCMLLSNTLDYALDKCQGIIDDREKSISIEGVWYKGYLMFKLYYTIPMNEFNEKKQHSSERMIKRAIAQDPYGMGCVAKSIRKYDGELTLQECGWGEEKLTFNLNAAGGYQKALSY